MSAGRPLPPQRVPTLTEVLPVLLPPAPPRPAGDAELTVLDEPRPLDAPPAAHEAAPALAPADVEEIAERVLAHLRAGVEPLVESVLRDVLSAALARAGERLAHDMREHLDLALRDLVSQAVAKEVARRRQP